MKPLAQQLRSTTWSFQKHLHDLARESQHTWIQLLEKKTFHCETVVLHEGFQRVFHTPPSDHLLNNYFLWDVDSDGRKCS